MHQTRAPKKKRGGFTITLTPRKHGVHVPVAIQIQQSALASAHRNDKRKTRNKAKAWKEERGA